MSNFSARSRGSVITPVSADAAAVSGEHNHTESSGVPERPGKFRGNVRNEFCPTAGACPMPMHPMHPRSEEHTSELQSRFDLVCRLLLEKKKHKKHDNQ